MGGTLLSLLFVAVCCGSFAHAAIKELGVVNIQSPGFLSFSTYTSDGSLALLISSFGANPFKTYGVYIIEDIASQLSNLSSVTPTLLSENPWPNVVTEVDKTIFNEPVLAIPSGFLVPGKSTGAITLLPNPAQSTSTSVQISVAESGFFYHNVTWIDMNGDGRLDILTARATKPILGTASGNMVWYEQPSANPLSQEWTPNELVEGPDFFLQVRDLDGDGEVEIIAAEFFAARLVVYYKSPNETWSNASIKSYVIDDQIGPLFDLEFTDLNGDGKIDLLCTNHINNASLSGVYAYEIPSNFLDAWPRHTLASGFNTIGKGPGAASPGIATSFFPNSSSSGGKPYIALAGDGNQAAYILTPVTQDPTSWKYNSQTIYSGKSTVGQIVAQDVNGDGFTEIFVALYDSDEILVFTYGQ